MAQIDTLTNVGAVVSTDLALILRGGANVLGTLGSMVGQNSTAVTITGGTINGTTIGATTPASVAATTLSTTGAATFGGNVQVNGSINTNLQSLSAWTANTRAIELTTYGAVSSNDNTGAAALSVNAYESSDSAWNRVAGTNAARFQTNYLGEHKWSNAIAAAGGTAISWVDQMTLSAAGALTTTGAATFGGNATVNGGNLVIGTGGGGNGLGALISKGAAANFYEAYDGTKTMIAGTDAGNDFVKIGSLSAHPVGFVVGNVDKMRIDASGNVGIGVVPEAWSAGFTALEVGGFSLLSTNSNFSSSYIQSNAYYDGAWKYKTTGLASQFVQTSGFSTWSHAVSGTADAALTWVEDMRLDASGNLLVGHSAQVLSSKVLSQFSGATHNGIIINETAGTASTTFAAFSLSGTAIGSITRVGATSAVAYNTTSDERLKSNIANSDPVLEKIMQVQVRQYDWTEGNLHQDYGFIAQELAPVLSGIVTEGKEEADMWQLDYSRLTPALLKAIQEQQAIIESLTARIEALEGAK
jgi:hypothetical protein